ncbi:MAG: cell-cycle regulation histidine triad protein [Paenibacillus sp.]|nr:cell-cycle regulation histidine triad protein [Paenibacillus sp.]
MTHLDQCPYCNLKVDLKQKIVFENANCYFLQHDDEQDVLAGCGVIVPKKHHADAFSLTRDEWNDTWCS